MISTKVSSDFLTSIIWIWLFKIIEMRHNQLSITWSNYCYHIFVFSIVYSVGKCVNSFSLFMAEPYVADHIVMKERTLGWFAHMLVCGWMLNGPNIHLLITPRMVTLILYHLWLVTWWQIWENTASELKDDCLLLNTLFQWMILFVKIEKKKIC